MRDPRPHPHAQPQAYPGSEADARPDSRPNQRTHVLLAVLTHAFGDQPFHVRDADDLNVARHRIERLCARGHVHRIGRGWYAVAAGSSHYRPRLQVLQEANPGVIACGTTAAAIWNLPLPPGVLPRAGHLEIGYMQDGSGQYGTRMGILARRWPFPLHHVAQGPGGERVTDPLRTAIDVARGLPLHLALVPLDAALRLASQTVDDTTAREILERHWLELRGGHGIRSLARPIAHAHPLAESPLESIVRGRILDAGLPEPALQVPVVGASGRHYRADMGLDLPGDAPGTFRLLIEADGVGKYVEARDLADEKRRQHDLERRGRVFVRVLYDEGLRRPAEFVGVIRRLTTCNPP